MEPLAIATHAVANRCGINKGDAVVVFGAGAIGLLAAQVAVTEGAGNVLLVGTSKDEKNRFKCAQKLGLETLNVEKENLTEKIMSLTNSMGVDVVIEASGSPAAVKAGLGLLKKTGRMAISGITGKDEIPISWDSLISKGASLFFCYSSVNKDWQKGLNYLADKKVSTLPLITHRFKLGQWQEAFETIENLEAIRPVFQISNHHKDSSVQFELIRSFTTLKLPQEKFFRKQIAFQTDNELHINSGTIGQKIDIWSLLQVPNGGKMYVRCDGKTPFRDYFSPIANNLWRKDGDFLQIDITGKNHYKIGIAPDIINGAVAYARKIADEYLVVYRKFFPQPWRLYSDVPMNDLRGPGDALQVYNDDGPLGGFGELEYHCPATSLYFSEPASNSTSLSKLFKRPMQ